MICWHDHACAGFNILNIIHTVQTLSRRIKLDITEAISDRLHFAAASRWRGKALAQSSLHEL